MTAADTISRLDAQNAAAADLAASLRGKGAKGLADALNTWTGPASLLFGHIAGRAYGEPAPVNVDMWHRAVRSLSSAECAQLLAPAGTTGEARNGTLRTGAEREGLAAEISSVVITSRIPPAAVTDLAGNAPLGLILGPVSRREPIGAHVYWGGVVAYARLWIGDLPVALAHEHVQPWICTRLERGRCCLDPNGCACPVNCHCSCGGCNCR